jgi:hypothetical protein
LMGGSRFTTEWRSRGCASRAKWNKQARAGRCRAFHRAVTRRTRACLPSPVLEPSGSSSPRCCHPPGSPPTRLPPPSHPPTGSSSTSSSKCWCSAAAAQDRRHQLLGDHPASPPRRVDQRRGGRAAAPGGAGRLRPAVRPGVGAPGGRRLHHQGALRRAGRRAQPGGLPQTGLKRSMVTDAGGIPLATLPAQLFTATMGCWRRRWTPSP